VILRAARIRAAPHPASSSPRTMISTPSRSRRRRTAARFAQEGPRADHRGHGELRDPTGDRDGKSSNAPSRRKQPFRTSGIVPYKLGHVAFHVTDVKAVTRFYCDVLGFTRVRLDGDYFSFLALRPGSSHHQSGRDWQEQALPYGVRAAPTGRTCRPPATCSAAAASRFSGAPAATASAQSVLVSPHPNGLITELFAELDQMKERDRSAISSRAVASRQPATPEDLRRRRRPRICGPMPPDEMME